LNPGKGYEKFFTPKGWNITAQGKRSAALGWDGNNTPTLKGLHNEADVAAFYSTLSGLDFFLC